MNIDVIHIGRKREESQKTAMYFDLEEKPGTSHNSGYMVPVSDHQNRYEKKYR